MLVYRLPLSHKAGLGSLLHSLVSSRCTVTLSMSMHMHASWVVLRATITSGTASYCLAPLENQACHWCHEDQLRTVIRCHLSGVVRHTGQLDTLSVITLSDVRALCTNSHPIMW